MPTLTSREFNQHVARAKRAADRGPVVITARGRPAYVLMRHETYRRLAAKGPGIRALLAHPEGEDVEFAPLRLGDDRLQPAKLG
jgi:prevent-host-death family protein